ncbi:MAG TPA: hypothetical protein ENK18_19115 [Deltaproteobacteria bacterium]|nr:hypothetical protein [Deltaproteobacteria bacterium]
MATHWIQALSGWTRLQGTRLQGTRLQGTRLQGTRLQGLWLQGLWLQGCVAPAPEPAPDPPPLVAITFNTGTTSVQASLDPDDGYTPDHAARSDAWYGDGLAWIEAIEAAESFFAAQQPDIVALQEIFWSGDCPSIPEEAWPDFVCASWAPGDPTVAARILGPRYQIACHPGKPDKCLAVHERLGTFRGCGGPLCLEGLDGATVEGCGSGARVGRGIVIRPDGSELTLVNLHGSSGLAPSDQDCRIQQIEQVFVDLGDGEPAASGEETLVLGDLNTDPGRWTDLDPSAARWSDFVGVDHPFDWVTEVGPDAPLTYQGVATIDHIASNTWIGDCTHPGTPGDDPPVLEASYFDHRPVICTLQRR